jgi:hypothetical protein
MLAGLSRHDNILTVEMLRSADGHDVDSRLLERLGQIVVHGNITQPGFCGAVTSLFDGFAANRYDLRVRILL